MERVAFLVGRLRIGCLLNPESVVVRRQAGLKRRASTVGRLTGAGLADDALLYTGGGRTELDLDLLFDLSLAGSSLRTPEAPGEVSVDDVRELTRPLWQLAENFAEDDGRGKPPVVRFVWGKAWNVPGVIAAVAERLERFSEVGAPSRSWLRLRMLRVAEPPPPAAELEAPPSITLPDGALPEGLPPDEEGLRFHRLLGDGEAGGERLDQLAERYYGHPAWWRLLARANDVDNPLDLPPNVVLQVPPPPSAVTAVAAAAGAVAAAAATTTEDGR